MVDRSDNTKINHSDELIEAIREASKNMSFDEYARTTGLEKEFIFRILKGDIEKVDDETYRKLSGLH